MLKKIIEKIRSSRTFLITTHMNLEGDALGSALGTYAFLKKLKKNAVVYNNDHTPHIYRFLPNSGVIKNHIENNRKFDVAMVLDCSDSSRTGKVKDYFSKARCIINIDHHISNTRFGDMNWIEPKKSSACQMLYKLFKKAGVMDRDIAVCLYTGIFTDTGNFTYSNTDKDTHRVVADLMKFGIHPSAIYRNLHYLCDPSDLRFMGKVISSLKYDSNRKICWAAVNKWQEKEYDLTEVIFSIMRLLKDVEVFVLFKKVKNNKIRVSFRSRASVDVNRVAKFFGGGGHKMASGTTVEESMDGAQKKIISFITRFTNGVKDAGKK